MGLLDTLREFLERGAALRPKHCSPHGRGEQPEMTAPQVRKAVLPVAGLGIDFLPITRTIPKEMLPLVDRPLIEYAVDEAAAAGINEVVLVTHRRKRMIEDHFDGARELVADFAAAGRADAVAKLTRSRQRDLRFCAIHQEAARGLGDALMCARPVLGDAPFALLLPDELFDSQRPALAQLLDQYRRTPTAVLGVMAVPPEHVDDHALARLVVDDARVSRLAGLDERGSRTPAGAAKRLDRIPLALAGRYILTPAIFACLETVAGSRGPAAEDPHGTAFDLSAALALLLHREPVFAVRLDGTRYDCGSKAGWLEATLCLALRDPDTAEVVRKTLRRLGEPSQVPALVRRDPIESAPGRRLSLVSTR